MSRNDTWYRLIILPVRIQPIRLPEGVGGTPSTAEKRAYLRAHAKGSNVFHGSSLEFGLPGLEVCAEHVACVSLNTPHTRATGKCSTDQSESVIRVWRTVGGYSLSTHPSPVSVFAVDCEYERSLSLNKRINSMAVNIRFIESCPSFTTIVPQTPLVPRPA